MEIEIWEALIGCIGMIIAAVIGKNWGIKGHLPVRFLKSGDSLKDELSKTSSISTYAVNSFELSAAINTMFEQNNSLVVKEATILVRLKPSETLSNIEALRNTISIWTKWHKKGNISKLKIVGYDHDPDHYYTILDNDIVFVGQVLFDDKKVTQTNVSYTPLVFTKKTKLGRQVISNYHDHFKNHVEKYKDRLLIFDSSTYVSNDPGSMIQNSKRGKR